MGDWWNAFADRAERRGEDLGRVDVDEVPSGPRVEVAKYAGACFGVQRALDLLEGVLDESEGTVRTLGPLIHNPRVVAELEGRGVEVVDEVPDDKGSTLVLRTHGVTPDVEGAAVGAGLDVVDATCPYVHTAQSMAEGLARDGYQVIVFGERGHPEVEGILARADDAVAVNGVDEALAVARRGLAEGRPLGLLAQTTQNEERFEAIADALRELADGDLEVRKTICHATRQRQEAAEELAGRADVMVVIGGRNSANTTRLAELCAGRCETHHIEGPGELDPRWFAGRSLVGVTAGASTPQAQIDEVVSAIG